MPVGVPKVRSRLPGEEEAVQWVDLFHGLFKRRFLFLCQELKEELANQLMGMMIYYDQIEGKFDLDKTIKQNGEDQNNIDNERETLIDEDEKNKDPNVYMYINCPGGSASCGIAVYDVMNFIERDITTICAGSASSMGSFLLTGGTREKRIALPHCRIMIHQPEGGSKGQSIDITSESQEVRKLREHIIEIYVERTGQSREQIIEDLDRDEFMSAHEAKKYGLVDHVGFTYDDIQKISGGKIKNNTI